MPFLTHDPKREAFGSRFALTPVALLALSACALLASTNLRAQERPGADADSPLVLKRTPLLQEAIPEAMREAAPTFMTGDRSSGRPDLETIVEGNAELRRGDMVIRADRLEYYQPDDLAKARGNVYVNRGGNVYEGPLLELKVESFEGFFLNPRYHLLKNGAHGEAERVDFIDDKRAVVRNATYTTCRREPGPSWMPDWILRAASIRLDTEEEVGQAEGAVLRFKDVPILAFPSMSFPLGDKRKSGFLPPTIGLDNINGVELSVPYYWNIAPNRDATFFPAIMTKRGVDLAGEFRYLEPSYKGQARLNYMPTDTLRDRSRWGGALQHNGAVYSGIESIGHLGLALNMNRVSDDNYWRDFARATTSLTQRLLPNDGLVTWGRGNFTMLARATKWQTLQDVTAPIRPPYDKLPQVAARYARANVSGLDFSVDGDYTQFEGDRLLTQQPNARRSYTLGQISRPWLTPGTFITPKLQLHATHYTFDAPLANGLRSASRTVPTFSLDSGLIFERDATYFGRAFRQTLEPRAFYVYTPFRDQSLLPNYDSGANDFNFATVYTENGFGGNDRISDNNLLTLGVTTRLYDPETGAEAARFGLAQRLRFKDQNVTLPGGTPASERLSDMLVGATINWTSRWLLDSTVQFNPKTQRSIRSTIGGRYNPGNYRVVSAAYRLQRGSSEQIDIGWQWPINDLWGQSDDNPGAGRGLGEGRWYSVGRMNYSMRDRKLVDSVIGLEYDAGCWLGRIVLERLQRSGATANQRILFQLELVGFSRLGTNSLKTLKDNIPRYQYLREQVTTPSRFSNYD
ncbi:MAG TPA: LPS-assembly protein LptD [Burkholderiaceae bacterium]|nr:LPS-assembly protein LptD [Burkholderiaceae bacterium]